jgi:hypothetical protein
MTLARNQPVPGVIWQLKEEIRLDINRLGDSNFNKGVQTARERADRKQHRKETTLNDALPPASTREPPRHIPVR